MTSGSDDGGEEDVQMKAGDDERGAGGEIEGIETGVGVKGSGDSDGPGGGDAGDDDPREREFRNGADSDDSSSVSDAEEYADRNSDPGVRVAGEADYALPLLPEGEPMRVVPPPQHASMSGGLGRDVLDPDSGPAPGTERGTMAKHASAPAMGRSPAHAVGGIVGGPGGGPPAVPPGGMTTGPLVSPGLGGETVSLGTATQTHEVRMPMLLPHFKPATGCTNASDFVVRCFVARLRSGITVVKHGRSRWCKSRLRVLHVHPDGRSLSWKPALGEPSSGKRPPKLDLTSCREVRHAWSPDPDNPMFTGTPILRQKCEAANAHKSFALVFPKRTVDITAVTADQCKVLMEGFSALCFRLQVAQNVAGQGGGGGGTQGQTGGTARKGEDDKATATESVTLTNASTGAGKESPKRKGGKKRSFRMG
ncbi:hypothetical protein ACHAWF_007774 [Thalassiosira exigua]